MQREDTQPWYRQFWPWFIIALPASAVVAGLYTVWIAMQTSDSFVVNTDDGIQKVTERNDAAEQEARRIGLSADIRIDKETGVASVTLSATAEITTPASLGLRLRHPTMASRDDEIELIQAMPDADGNPVWVGHFLAPPEGRRYLTLSSGDTWRMSAEWSGETRLTLEPNGQPSNGPH